jgi:hypothetical protein
MIRICQFAAKQNISMRAICSPQFCQIIKEAIIIGQTKSLDPPSDLIPHFSPHTLKREFVTFSDTKYFEFLNLYKRTPGSALCIDAGKHKTRPYLIIILMNVMYRYPPLIVSIVRYFRGRAVDYVTELQNITEELAGKGIIISGIVSDNLSAQVSAINPEKQSCFQNFSHLPSVKAIIWIPCSCHTLQLALKDSESKCEYGSIIKQLDACVIFLRRKIVVNLIGKTCPTSSSTRWTGRFDAAVWILRNSDHIANCILHNLTKREAIDIPSMIIEGFTTTALMAFKVLLPYILASNYLEREQAPAAFIVPIIRAALSMAREMRDQSTIQTPVFDAMASAVENRFMNTESWKLLSFLYSLTPAGRFYYRNDPASNLKVKGPLDGGLVIDQPQLLLTSEYSRMLESIRSQPNHYSELCTTIEDAFQQYTGTLTNIADGRRTKHDYMEPDDLSYTVLPIQLLEESYSYSNNHSSWLPQAITDGGGEDLLGEEEEESDESNPSLSEDSSDSDYVPSRDEQITSDGILEDSANVIKFIADRQKQPPSAISALQTYFINWLSGHPEQTIPNLDRLNSGLSFWEYMATIPKHRLFGDFVLPLLSIPASEAIVERAFSFQRRIIGEQSIRMSIRVEKARLNLALYERDSSISEPDGNS